VGQGVTPVGGVIEDGPAAGEAEDVEEGEANELENLPSGTAESGTNEARLSCRSDFVSAQSLDSLRLPIF
jgi:hypothetical protein